MEIRPPIRNGMDELVTRFLKVLLLSLLATPLVGCGISDFGLRRQRVLELRSHQFFGFGKPLDVPATADDAIPRESAGAEDRQFLAAGLRANFVARNLAQRADMIAFWPNDIHYTHLILCIEQGRSGVTPAGSGGLNPSVQRIDLSTGAVETVLYGMDHCDGIRTTPWGTILATEEVAGGSAFEILSPVTTTGHWIADHEGAGVEADIRTGIDSSELSATVTKRIALPTKSWEGLSVLHNGVVYSSDELRPGLKAPDLDGGAVFKFVPDVPYECLDPISGSQLGEGGTCSNPISSLADSPLASGQVYAVQVSCLGRTRPGFPQSGQGCEVGEAAWIKVDAANARVDAYLLGATGYDRPEDLHRLRAPEDTSVTFCWSATGNAERSHFGEVICARDENPLGDGVFLHDGREYLGDTSQPAGFAIISLNRFLEGDDRFNSFDNLDIQPATGNIYVVEDAQFGEIFACLPDGADRDIKTDGCVAMLSIRDPIGEPTGFIFDGTGEVAFYVVQHGQQPPALLDFFSNPLDGTTDDLMVITGFRTQGIGNGQ